MKNSRGVFNRIKNAEYLFKKASENECIVEEQFAKCQQDSPL